MAEAEKSSATPRCEESPASTALPEVAEGMLAADASKRCEPPPRHESALRAARRAPAENGAGAAGRVARSADAAFLPRQHMDNRHLGKLRPSPPCRCKVRARTLNSRSFNELNRHSAGANCTPARSRGMMDFRGDAVFGALNLKSTPCKVLPPLRKLCTCIAPNAADS